MQIYAAHDGGSGCAWYRMFVPLQAIDRLADGVDVHFRQGGPKMMNREDQPLYMTEVNDADIIIAQRANAFEGLGTWRRLSTPTCRTVYENDDDIWHITRDNKQAYDVFAEGETAREVVLRMCATANMVTCTTPYLRDMHFELAPHVPIAVLPNYIPEFVLNMKHDDRQGRHRLGWMGGASHNRDIHVATSSVRRFMKRFPDWDLYLSGVDYRKEFGCPPERSFHLPWISVCDHPEVFYRTIDYDIGICPLLDTQFARSKSWVKALEYMARGMPVIASDVEPYRKFVKHGENGFLVKRDHEWLSALSELAGDEALRLQMGENARLWAAEHTIEKHYTEWVSAYATLFPVGWEYKPNAERHSES